MESPVTIEDVSLDLRPGALLAPPETYRLALPGVTLDEALGDLLGAAAPLDPSGELGVAIRDPTRQTEADRGGRDLGSVPGDRRDYGRSHLLRRGGAEAGRRCSLRRWRL